MAEYTIEKIKISGFRRLRSIELLMKPFIVLIGANGVGKTSFLDTLALLSASASGNLNNTLSQWGGITSLLTRGKMLDMSFEVDMNVPGKYEPLRYELKMTSSNSSYSISKETLSQNKGQNEPLKHIDSRYNNIKYFDVDKNRFINPTWEHSFLETSLSQAPKMFQQPEELRRILSTVNLYHALEVGPRAPVKLPQAMKPAHLPGANGEDLIPYLYYLRESEPERFDAIIDTLKAAFPDFNALSFPPVAAGMLTMAWHDSNFTKPIYMHELSEGTLRFIWLTALLHSPNLSMITMIDEPEVSLHPELLSVLIEVMRETSKSTQLVIATHSDRLVRFLKPDEIVVMDISEDGSANAAWANSMDLDGWLSEYSLDQIWQMGRMGGRA
jgi:predicted ATPase